MRIFTLSLLVATAFFPQAPPDIKSLAADAQTHLKKSRLEQLNYTFIDTENDRTHMAFKFPSNHTTVSETIALLGTQYTRRLQVDGKPLEGDALKHEQELYEQAIKERQTVEDVRSREKGHLQHTSSEPANLLETSDIRVLGHEFIDGRPCIRLRFDPRPGSKQTSRVTWWVDDSTHEVLKEDRELISIEDHFLPGTHFSTHFTSHDGVLLANDSTMDITWDEPALKNRRIHGIVTHTFTNYRRFRATVTITTPPEGSHLPQE